MGNIIVVKNIVLSEILGFFLKYTQSYSQLVDNFVNFIPSLDK